MSTTPDATIGSRLAADQVVIKKSSAYRPARNFFAVMAVIFIVMSLFAFIPSYQHLEDRLFPMHWFVNVHGGLMSGWLLVFLTQSLLAANDKLKIHRRLGQFAAVLGMLVWISMGVVSALVFVTNDLPVEHFLFDVLIIQLYGMALFGLFFTWGVLVRKNAAAHKRLLFLATLVLIQAAIDRIHWLPWLHDGLAVRFYYLDAFFIALITYDLLVLRRVHKITWIGAMIFIVAQVIVVQSWGSSSWHTFWFNLVNEFR